MCRPTSIRSDTSGKCHGCVQRGSPRWKVEIKVTPCFSFSSLSDGEGEIRGPPTMNAPPWLEIILTRVSPAVQKSPSMQWDCVWHVVSSVPGLVPQRLAAISHDSASGCSRWTVIYARGEAANASQPGITLVLLLQLTTGMYEQIVRDWPTQTKVWLVISLKVHHLNNVS